MNQVVAVHSQVVPFTDGIHVTQEQYQADRTTVVEVITELGNQLQTSNSLLKSLQGQVQSITGEKQAVLEEVQTLKAKQQHDADQMQDLLARVQRVAQENRQLQKSAMDQAANSQRLGLELNGVKRNSEADKERAKYRESLLTAQLKLQKEMSALDEETTIRTASTTGSGVLGGIVTGFIFGGPLGALAGGASLGLASFGGANLATKVKKQPARDQMEKNINKIDEELKKIPK